MGVDVVVEDRVYVEHAGEPLLARIYRPAQRTTGGGAVVDVHPGAWSEGDRTWGEVYNQALARRGFVVVALDFRQGPRFQHPSASADVATGVRWVRAASEPLGIDPSRISVTGSSSGGHLALLAALRPNEAEHSGRPLKWDRGGVVDEDIDAAVGCVAALWPPVDPMTRYNWLLERLEDATDEQRVHYESLRRGMDAYFGDRKTMHLASAPRMVREGEATHLPPIWVCYPELDQNVPLFIIEDLEKAVRDAGRHIEVRLYPGQTHAFGHRPGPATDEFVGDLAQFLEHHS